LIAGRGRGALSSLLSTMCTELAVRTRREELHMLAFARPQALASVLARLPHQVGAFVDPTDHLATTAAMHDLRAELLRRMERVERGALANTLPDLVVIVPELELAIEHQS